MTEPELPLRQAVRGLLIDPEDRVLLVKLDLSFTDWTGWVLPGGGVESGEDAVTALRRELIEETGLADAFVGPLVCNRRQVGPGIATGYGGQHDAIYLVPCRQFTPAPAFTEEELRAEGVVEIRWFTLDELRAITNVRVVPRDLVGLIERVLEFGGSVEPLEINVVERTSTE